MRVIVSGGRVVLPDRVVDRGSVVVEDGRIVAVSGRAYGASHAAGEVVIDASGRLVLPGLVDLHDDAIEKEITPRPRASLPLPLAVATLERRLLAAGVTTEFHAIFFADMIRNDRSLGEAPARARAVLDHDASGRAAVRHHVLFRVDLWAEGSLESVLAASEGAAVPLVSLNDHTPGQGQYRDVENFKRYHHEYLGRPSEAVERDTVEQMRRAQEQPEIAETALRRVAAVGRERGLILMSHDDDSPERVELMYALGARIAEFPITVAAAERQRQLGMWITAGAPNVVRRGSATGNIAALDLIRRGLVDILCADYHAPSLLHAVLGLAGDGELGLPEAVRLVSLNPARAVGLDGAIGSLETGKAGDVIVVDPSGPTPLVEAVVRAGSVRYCAPGAADAGRTLTRLNGSLTSVADAEIAGP